MKKFKTPGGVVNLPGEGPKSVVSLLAVMKIVWDEINVQGPQLENDRT